MTVTLQINGGRDADDSGTDDGDIVFLRHWRL
jgi:hypothetical protein